VQEVLQDFTFVKGQCLGFYKHIWSSLRRGLSVTQPTKNI
jgi:hypothetical protein